MWCTHGVSFPSTDRTPAAIGLHPSEIVLFRDDLGDARQAIERLIEFHRPPPQAMSGAQVLSVARLLAPTVTIRSTLHTRAATAVKRQLVLTEQQRTAMGLLRFLRRVWITGAAGTGKTILAVERARQVAAEGGAVLLLCFNAQLARRLRAEVADDSRITAGKFHGFAADRSAPRPQGVSDAEWFDQVLPANAFETCIEDGSRWDAIIIDEGQDFLPEWVGMLEQLLVEDGLGLLVLFSDQHQNLFRPSGAAGLPEAPMPLDTNCRNTPEVSARSLAPLGISGRCAEAASGVEPTLIRSTPGELLTHVRKELHRIVVDEGVDIAQPPATPPALPVRAPLRPLLAREPRVQQGLLHPRSGAFGTPPGCCPCEAGRAGVGEPTWSRAAREDGWQRRRQSHARGWTSARRRRSPPAVGTGATQERRGEW